MKGGILNKKDSIKISHIIYKKLIYGGNPPLNLDDFASAK